LPHVWIQPSSQISDRLPEPVDLSYVSDMTASERSQRQYSSLDLCACDKFTLLVSASTEPIGMKAEVLALLNHLQIPLSVFQHGNDFSVREGDRSSSWTQKTGLASGGAVLVRPDQHILALFTNTFSAHDVASAIAKHFGFRLGTLTPPTTC